MCGGGKKFSKTGNRDKMAKGRIASGDMETMTNTTVLIADMAILVGIFLLGFLAKVFPKSGRNAGSKQ